MKKILSLILALCLGLTLAACSADPEPTTVPATDPVTTPTSAPTETPTETTVPEQTDPTVEEIVYDVPMAAISITEQTEITNGKKDTPVFEYTYQNIRLLLPDADMAMNVNLDILNRIDATRSITVDIMNDAVSADPEFPYSFTLIYEPMRLDTAVLSLFGMRSIYNGGSALQSGHGLTYDLTTGNTLTLADVLAPDTTADMLCPLVINALSALPEEYYLFSDFSMTVEDRFSGDFMADESWHLSDDGLCFTFAPYEIAPNSTGFVHAVIPYEQLSGILNDAWFPQEQVTPNGALEVLPFSQEDADEFDQFAELYLDRDGSSYLLHSTGLIYDVVIEIGIWNGDGTSFTAQDTVFKANSLVPSDAVMIRTVVEETLPALRITYTAAEGTVTVYFSTSGEDGFPLLLTY